MSFNKVVLVGRLGNEPKHKVISQNNSVCQFSLATSEKYKDKSGESVEKTEWHNIVVWGKQGDNCAKYLNKGSQVFIEGKLQTRSYDKDGENFYITEIVAINVRFLNSNVKEIKDKTNSIEYAIEPSFDNINDDIPF